LEKFETKAQKKKLELTQVEAASQEADDPNDERRNRLDELSKEAGEMSIRKRELEQELKRLTEPRRAFTNQFKGICKKEKLADRELLESNQRLQGKRDEIVQKAGSAESEQAQRNKRLRDAEERLAERKIRHDELKQSTTDLLQSYEKVEPEVQGARQNVSQLEHQVRGIDSKIRGMESSSGNSLDVFGHRCNKVKQLVDKATQQRKFRGPVLGPVGFFCKVQPGKEEFAALAEAAIGTGTLDRFVVFNDTDRKLFQKIRRDAGCQSDCNVFQQSQHSRYNIPEAPQGVETVASVLAIENDLIFNCLVDNAKIDQKALTRNKEDGEAKLLVKDNHGRHCIRGGKIKEVFLLPHGDNWKVLKGGKLTMNANSRRLKQSIGVDRTAAIEEAKEEYQAMNEELKGMNREYNRLEHEHTDLKKRWNASKKDMYKTNKEIDQAKKDIEDTKAEESESAEMEVDTTLEEQDVAEAQDILDDLKEKKAKVQEEMKELIPLIAEKEADVAEISARNEKVLVDIKNAENELTQHYHALTQQKEKLEKTRKRLEQYTELVRFHSADIEEAEEEANSYLRSARKIQFLCESIERRRKQREAREEPTGDTQVSAYSQEPTDEDLENVQVPDNLDNLKETDYYLGKIQQANTRIEREKERRLENSDDEDAAYEKYVRAREIFQAKKDQINEIDSVSKQLDADMANRRTRWGHYRDFISGFSGNKFDEIRKSVLIVTT
jgi:chromosome segregation ATPase